MGKPHRLPRSAYTGRVSVFITCATHGRRRIFEHSAVCESVIAALRHVASNGIELTAYCLMPDHGHVLLTGLHEGADLLDAVCRWKQKTGYEYRSSPLWQGNFHDWVLRDAADCFAVARYIVSDPVRSGIVTDVRDYRWWGSDRWGREELARDVWEARAPAWWRD